MGGVAAAGYAKDNQDDIEGLVLWASYPSEDMSVTSLQAVSIYATNDGLTTEADIEDSKSKLPSSTTYVEITGGNHAQFGYYGTQRGDGEATISRADQQEQMVTATLDLLAVI